MSSGASLGHQHIRGLLDRFAGALISGDGQAAAACWQVPALVVADGETRAIGSTAEIADFFGAAAAHYQSRGIHSTRPDIQRITLMGADTALVMVRWPYLDAAGHDTGAAEASDYLVLAAKDGDPKICVAVMLGAV
jgi:hypothetical protein